MNDLNFSDTVWLYKCSVKSFFSSYWYLKHCFLLQSKASTTAGDVDQSLEQEEVEEMSGKGIYFGFTILYILLAYILLVLSKLAIATSGSQTDAVLEERRGTKLCRAPSRVHTRNSLSF